MMSPHGCGPGPRILGPSGDAADRRGAAGRHPAHWCPCTDYGSHANYEALREGLRALGYIEGQTIIIECRETAGRYERVTQHADELVRLKVDVLITDGLPAARAAKEATKTIPIVMGARIPSR
jgi:hypothetical protein